VLAGPRRAVVGLVRYRRGRRGGRGGDPALCGHPPLHRNATASRHHRGSLEGELTMDHETEHIHQQMMETPTALTEKLESLENQVFGSVHEATRAVSQTVASVKEAVQETVGSLKESVQETVHSVKESVNIKRQVDRHPWVMMAGSVALGYV